MSVNTPLPIGNDLVDSLPSAEKNRVIARCDTVKLVSGTHLCDAGQIYDYAWFPLTGLTSQGSKLHHHRPLDMGLIGHEGMLGVTLALGVDTAPLVPAVSGTGAALRIRASEFRLALGEGAALQQRVDQYLYTVFAQIARTEASNSFHAIKPRLARCLLTATDRVAADYLQLTHDALAAMLGVRRSGVTVAARALGHQGLIRYARGEIVILDRDGLKAAACTCYADWPAVTPHP